MAMLHIVNKSPFERNTLDTCIDLSKDGSAILLIEDAVVAARKGSNYAEKLTEAMSNRAVFALGPDMAARALDEAALLDGIRVVDYAGFVDLTLEYDNVQSWL